MQSNNRKTKKTWRRTMSVRKQVALWKTKLQKLHMKLRCALSDSIKLVFSVLGKLRKKKKRDEC